MDIITLILMPFATWRITSFLVVEKGPFNIFDKLRILIGIRYNEMNEIYGKNMIAEGLTCIWCASVWVAFGFVVLYYFLPNVSFWIELPFAISSIAIFIERIMDNG